MATDARPLSLIQAVVDLQRQARRHQTRNVGGAPIWEYDTFAITGSGDTTHTLSWLPYGINVVLLNGLGLVEGVDYSCDYTAGVVTVTATLAAGDTLHVRYVTTGDLMVFSTAADTGGATDTFNRANSTTTLGTTSDGHYTWVPFSIVGGTFAFGIISNTAYLASGFGAQRIAYIDAGRSDLTAQVTAATIASGGESAGLMLRLDTSNASGFALVAISGTGSSALWKFDGVHPASTLYTFSAVSGDVIGAYLNGSSITVRKNGVDLTTVTDSMNQTMTKFGLYMDGSGSRLDDFNLLF